MRNKRSIKVIIEKHMDGYVAYPIGLKGVVVGQGNTYNEALKDVCSAIHFHQRTFRQKSSGHLHEAVLEAFVAEVEVS